jgi:serine/threonine protein kinase
MATSGDTMRSLARKTSSGHGSDQREPSRPTGPTQSPVGNRMARGTVRMPPGAPPLPFDVRALLANGGMSHVYLVVDRNGQERAVKMLRPELAVHGDLIARFLAEHEVSCRIQHENIVRVFDAQLVHGVPYLLMELVDGQPLAAVVDHMRLSPGAIAGIGAQVASALAHAHAHRILHCDVKPDNVLMLRGPGIAGWPRVKLIDFGVARFQGEPGIGDEVVSGTPAYMAPEQWHGEATQASDIYALGCVLYELVTGRPPFTGSYADIMHAHLEAPPVPPAQLRRDLPPALEALILAMLAKAPRARPVSMDEVAAHLADLACLMPPAARALTTGAIAVANDFDDDDDDWATS